MQAGRLGGNQRTIRARSRGRPAAAETRSGRREEALVMRSERNRGPGPGQGRYKEEETGSPEGGHVLLWNGPHWAAGWAGVTSLTKTGQSEEE